VRAIVLDTVDRAGGSRGVVSAAQVAWLRDQLARAGTAGDRVSHNPLESVGRRRGGARGAHEARASSPRRRQPPSQHDRPHTPRRGYWLIGTSSLADCPQQAAQFRLRRARGGVALETWMVDHDGRGVAGRLARARLPRRPGRPPAGLRRTATDRNARLYVPAR
jgi:hypothetical protein